MVLDFFSQPLQQFMEQVLQHCQQLPPGRHQLLDESAGKIIELLRSVEPVNLLFVCTHNSRRSQFSQLWASVATTYYGVDSLHSYSCGTEATACNPRTIESLRRVGLQVESENGNQPNPLYRCSYRLPAAAPSVGSGRPVELFSKAFGHPSLPTQDIVAMMCCDEADTRCPVVPGARHRVPLHYQDPKQSDGTPTEEATYDRRSLQIASEMFYLVQRLRVGS